MFKVSSHDALHARGLTTREKLRKLCLDATSAYMREQESNIGKGEDEDVTDANFWRRYEVLDA